MLQTRPPEPRVLEAEEEGGGAALDEGADERVVRVGRHDRRPGQRRHRRLPPGGEMLELAVAVELIAKEVSEHEDAGPRSPKSPGSRGLVDLEQPELGVPSARQRAAAARAL